VAAVVAAGSERSQLDHDPVMVTVGAPGARDRAVQQVRRDHIAVGRIDHASAQCLGKDPAAVCVGL
jgi:hypothetical protein